MSNRITQVLRARFNLRRLQRNDPPEPANPWDAVNALKVDLAAHKAGGAPAETITALELQLSAAEAALPAELRQ